MSVKLKIIKFLIFLPFLFLSSENSYSQEPEVFIQTTVDKASNILGQSISTDEKIKGLKEHYGVKSKNGAGEWSTAGVSDGLTILSSSPKVTKIEINNKEIIENQFIVGGVSVNSTIVNTIETTTTTLLLL